MSDNIKVAIKVRPLIKRERDDRLPIQWMVEENTIIQIDPETNKKGDTQFHFDYIFDMGQTNQDVFDATVQPIVEAAMKGFNGTIFAYGQTGSGKTYTMMGTKNESGVIPLVINYIFNYIRNDASREFLLRVSYIEIYNERIYDLLDKNRIDLKIKEDQHGHITIDCKEEVTNSPDCVLHVMKKGDKNRRTGETNMNERSSRSHTIFRITIESCEKSDPDGTAMEAQLNLIDLAGSERARQTGATGERFNEGRHINLSLSTLSLVIKQLSESQSCGKYINFRDSKLTRILQPSLGGNALTTIICAVTPAADDETQCTLAFAVRAKGIKNKPKINENVSDKALLKRIRNQKAKLEAEMQDMKTELAEKDKQLLLGRIALMNMQILTCNSQQEDDIKIKARRRRTWAGSSTSGSNSSNLNFVLPTIDEYEHQKPESEIDELIKQQNIYEMDVLNQSFHTAFADFELQLIEDQREKNRMSNSSDCEYVAPSVTVRPQIIIKESDDECINIVSPEKTPEHKHNSLSSDPSPSTPKTKLRERLDHLRTEFTTLREFTTLEKQLLQTEGISGVDHTECEKNLAYMNRSLTDTEQMCKDLNKKYAELQSEHAILLENYELSTRDCKKLYEEVESLSSLRQGATLLELERNDFKSKMNFALDRQKSLEYEIASHTYEMDILKSKHKNREKELEESLNLAWKEFIDPSEKKKLTDIIHLQSVINELTAKVSSLEAQSNATTQSRPFNDDYISKINELEQLLKQSQEENTILNERNSQVQNEFQIKTEEFTKQIEELEQIIIEKDKALVDNNTQELTAKFYETNDKLKGYESRVEEMRINIEQLQLDLLKKNSEVSEIKNRLEMTLEESENLSKETQNQLRETKEQLEMALLAIKSKEEEILEVRRIISQKVNESQPCGVSINSAVENTTEESEKLSLQLKERNFEIIRLQEFIKQSTISFHSTIESNQIQINGLLATNEKLRDQISIVQSDKLLCDGNIAAMQTMIEEKDDQLQMISKLEKQLEFASSEKIELERMISDLRTQLNEKILLTDKMPNFESEINNLNSYVASLQNFVKKLQSENEELKKEVEDKMSVLNKLELNEIESPKSIIGEDSDNHDVSKFENSIRVMTINEFKSPSRICQVVKPLNITETPRSTKKMQPIKHVLAHDDKESSSIFTNDSYFDNMDFSTATNELSELTLSQNFSMLDGAVDNKSVIDSKLEDSKALMNLTCDELDKCLSEKNSEELVNIVKELFSLKTTLEEENTKLAINLESKIRETAGIQNDFCAFKIDFEKLQQSILLLTTENADMAGKLAVEKQHANEIQMNLRKQINELNMQIQTLLSERENQEAELGDLSEKKNNFDNLVTINEDKNLEENHEAYQEQIKILTNENVELSNNLMERIDELEILREKYLKECNPNCIFRERVSNLERENIDLSNNLMSKIEELDVITEEYTAFKKSIDSKSINVAELETQVHCFSQFITELKSLNAQLPDMKSMTCQCNQQNELQETRHAIKKNMKLLNDKLHEFQDNFNRISAEAEKLTSRAHQDMNPSLYETSMNISGFDNADITMVEGKVQQLQFEYNMLHENLQKWSLFNDKMSESDKLHDNNSSILDTSRQSHTESPKMSKRDAKIDQRQNELEKCKMEQQQLAKTIKAFEKFQNDMHHMHHEIKNLRTAKDIYKEKINNAEKLMEAAQEQVRILKDEVTASKEQFNLVHENNEALEKLKTSLEKQIEDLKCEKNSYEQMTNELQTKLEKLTGKSEENSSLIIELEKCKENILILEDKVQNLTDSLEITENMNNNLKSELDLVKSTPPPEREQVKNLTETLEQYKENVGTLETSVRELREKLICYEKENVNLSGQINKLQVPQNKVNLNESDYRMEVCDESFNQNLSDNKVTEELADARARIIKEIATLQRGEVKNSDDKSVSDLFGVFLTTIMAKEQEVIKTMIRHHEHEKQGLLEQKKQAVSAEKRASAWASELEADIERIQNDLTKLQKKNKTLAEQISKLENSLMDSEHEKQLLKEKIAVMETDFNTLQTDYDKQLKSFSGYEEVTNEVNEREKSLQEAIDNRDSEHKAKISQIKQEFQVKIDEVSRALEISKAKNEDLKRDLEAQEANERQLKSIIDLKTSEFAKVNNTAQCLENELKDLTKRYDEVSDENQIKSQKIDEITALLKIKCDKMSEYKTNLETIKPEYEMLKVQASERQQRLETYKSEIEKMRDDNMRQMSVMKDQLDLQEIKTIGLNKQLADVINRNTVVQSELEHLKEKIEELEHENERLVKKMRNSTSKLTVEREMEDLRDENRTHLKNLEGASNRITELQKLKSQLIKDHVELQGRFEFICQENKDLKNSLNRNKMSSNEMYDLREKYDALIQEKNRIALELEEKRSGLIQLEGKFLELTKENNELKKTNVELDTEMDDIVQKIHEMDEENTELQRKLYELEDNKCNDSLRKISAINNSGLDSLKKHYEETKKEYEIAILTIDMLKRDNEELKFKISNRNDPRSNNSSRSESPTPMNLARQRRSDLFNQNRLIDEIAEIPISDCQCPQLRKKIIELEQEIVSKKAKIVTLEMQITSEMFPYQVKCSQYEEAMLAYKQQNMKLLAENDKLREKKIECERCMNQKLLNCDKATQMSPKKEKISLVVNRTGIVEEHTMEQLKMNKLENDKLILKKQLKRRIDEMGEMKERIKELQMQLETLQSGSNIMDKNYKHVMKENVPANVSSQPKLLTQRNWLN